MLWLAYPCAYAQDLPRLDKILFTKDNVPRLCVQDGTELVVKRGKLAWALIAMGRPFDDPDEQMERLRYATVDGRPVLVASPNELAYFVSSGTPFGISKDKDYTPEQKLARDRQLPYLISLRQWLGRPNDNKNFKLVGPTPDIGTATPEQYFQDTSYKIVCTAKKKDVDGNQDKAGKTAAQPDFSKSIVVRKTVADIPVSSNDLKKANGAQFSYTDDSQKAKQTISVEGLVGVVIFGTGTGFDRAQQLDSNTHALASTDTAGFSSFKIVPYVYYKGSTQRPAPKTTKDIDYFAPGVTGNFTWINAANTIGLDIQLNGSNTRDNAQESSVYDVGVSIAPSFLIPDGPIIFGAPIGFFDGAVRVRPDLALVAREYSVEDRGINPDLKGVRSYTGLGYDLSAQIFPGFGGSVLENFVGKVGYTARYNSNDVVDVSRFWYGLSYIINTNVTIDLDYVNGRDPNTLQQEQTWKAALSFRN